jgi:hypothetical protein
MAFPICPTLKTEATPGEKIMPYEPVNVTFLKDGEPEGLSDRLLDLQDINVFLENLHWIEGPMPFQLVPIRAMARRKP